MTINDLSDLPLFRDIIQEVTKRPSWEKNRAEYPELLTAERVCDLCRRRLGIGRTLFYKAYRSRFRLHFRGEVRKGATRRKAHYAISFDEANKIIDSIISISDQEGFS